MTDLSFAELMRSVGITDHGKLGFHLRVLKGLVELVPSAKGYRLTERGQLASELLWDTRFIMAKSREGIMLEPARYVRRLKLGEHAVLFYHNQEFKHATSFPFLQIGLLKGEAVIYLVSEDRLSFETREIVWYGIDTDFFRNKALTIMSAEEWYMTKGKARAEKIIGNWLKLLHEKHKAGFAGIRIAGEMEVFFSNAKTEEMLKYETMLGKQLHPHICGLCMYNMERLDKEKQFIELSKMHGHSISRYMTIKTE